MIYKVLTAAAIITPTQAVFKLLGSYSGGNGDFHRIRGASYIGSGDTDVAYMHYTTTAGSSFGTAANLVSTITTPTTPAPTEFNIQDMAVGQNAETGPIMFTSEVASVNMGQVLYYRGEYTQWSVQQVLTPPAEFSEQNYFGLTLALDKHDLKQLAVGCPGCNSSYYGSGTVYVYEPETPSAKKWVRRHALSPNRENMFYPGAYTLSVHKDTLATSYHTTDGHSATGPTGPARTVLFAKEKGKWNQVQELSTLPVSDVSVYDQTVIVGDSSSAATTAAGGSVVGKVHVLYPSTDEYHLKPAGKPRPTQWSVQQVLVQPSTTGTNHKFGSAVSIDRNRLAVSSENEASVYMYERKEVFGHWSLQQTITTLSPTQQNGLTLSGSTLEVSWSGSHLYDETERWDCLIVSVEDHFNDGWDTAELTVEVPGGDKDSFTSRCDLTNPFQFRYCPADRGDSGLYKFSIPDAAKAKFHWEIVWRVYEEKSGNWYTGNGDSKMDFEWDSSKAAFSHKKMDRLLPNNITCKECPQKPRAKPKALRQLKDSTHAPTVSPAPTLAVTNSLVAWQEIALVTQGNDWFDAQHKGTSYYISDKAGRRLLSTGTLCPWETNPTSKTCWEEYPDGEYILRVGGALDRDTTHTFRYCKSANDLTQESQMIFRVSNGDCEIRSVLQSTSFCSRNVGLVQSASLTITIQGVSGAIGATENAHIASAVASVLSGIEESDVSVTSSRQGMSGLEVTLEVKAHSTRLGLDLTDPDTLDLLEANMLTSLQGSEGAILTALVSSTSASAVHSATHLTLGDFHLSGHVEQDVLVSVDSPDEVVDMADSESSSLSTGAEGSSFNATKVLAMGGYVFAGVAVVALVGFFVASRASVSSDMQAVPVVEMTASSPEEGRARESQKTTITGRVLTPNDLRELVSAEEASLKSMLHNAPQI